MNLQIDYLRTFIALAETKSFTKAGIQVNRSQSAVSMQIKRLEDEIGKKLFERIGKTVKLTAEGHILIKYAMRIVKEHDDATPNATALTYSVENSDGNIFVSPTAQNDTLGLLSILSILWPARAQWKYIQLSLYA